WAGGVYSHLTRLESGKHSRTKRSVRGMLAGWFSGLVVGFLGIFGLVYVVTHDVAGLFSDMSGTLETVLIVGGAAAFLSLFGGLIYIFGIQPGAEGKVHPKTINDWLQLWWVRGMIVVSLSLVLGFVLVYLDQGYLDFDANIGIAVISIILGVFGFVFYPHK